MNVIFAPHLDDEVIGCYSILDEVEWIVFFQNDYRVQSLTGNRYIWYEDWVKTDKVLTNEDVLYIPSKFDYHPLHRRVRAIGIQTLAKLRYYSVEMNVPWLEEEASPKKKEALFNELYPLEHLTDNKYWLFKSIKPFDDIVFAEVTVDFIRLHRFADASPSVSFLKNLHRHKFYLTVWIQQFEGDREVEYLMFQAFVRQIADDIVWHETTSCEEFANKVLRRVQIEYPGRLVRVRFSEDNENGCLIL